MNTKNVFSDLLLSPQKKDADKRKEKFVAD